MRIPRGFLWLFIIFFVQQLSWTSQWGINLPLIFVVLMGLRRDMPRAAGWGFLYGALQDLLSAGGVGPNAISETIIGMTASFFRMRVYHEKVLTQTFLIFVLSVFHGILEFGLMRWSGVAPRVEDAFWIICQHVFFTTLVGLVVCFFVVQFRRRRFDPATA